jgi:MFS transporter, NNP family, nitrate/nitrite transporter
MSDESRFSAALPRLLFLTLVVFMGILPRLLLAPMLLRISQAFNVSYSDLSGLFLTGSLGFVTGLLTSGFVASRLTHRWTIVASIGVNAIALLALSTVRGLAGFHIGFIAINWASGLYPGSGIASVIALVHPDRRGTALAIHESGPNLAFLIAPILVAVLAPFLGWRGLFRVTGLAALLVAVAFALFGTASSERGQSPSFQNVSLFLRNKPFWVVSVLFVVSASGAMGVFSVLPTYLMVDHALPEGLVNTLVGLSRVTGFASILLAGTLADRHGFRLVVIVVLGTTGIVTMVLGFASGVPLLVAVFLQPLLVGAFFPLGLSALSDVAPPQSRNLAVALAIPLANFFGAGVTPRLMSWAGAAGSFRLSFVVLGALTLASLWLLRWMGPKAMGPRVDTTRAHPNNPAMEEPCP